MGDDYSMHPDIEKFDTPDKILISDPLTKETKRIRTSLIIISSVAIFTGTLGGKSLKIINLDSIGTNNASAVISCILIYMIITFIMGFIQDYKSWNILEKALIGEEQKEILIKIESNAMNWNQMLELIDSDIKELYKKMEIQAGNLKSSLDLLEKLCRKKEFNDYDFKQTIKRINGNLIIPIMNFSQIKEENIGKLISGIKSNQTNILLSIKNNLIKKLKTIDKSTRSLRIVQYSRLYLIEFGLPFILCLIALKINSGNTLSLLKQIFTKLIS